MGSAGTCRGWHEHEHKHKQTFMPHHAALVGLALQRAAGHVPYLKAGEIMVSTGDVPVGAASAQRGSWTAVLLWAQGKPPTPATLLRCYPMSVSAKIAARVHQHGCPQMNACVCHGLSANCRVNCG